MLTLTDSAVRRAKKIAELQGMPGHDLVFEFQGLKVLVDPKSAPYLEGVQVDFHETLTSAGFKFNNPNAKAECGCGTSFSC